MIETRAFRRAIPDGVTTLPETVTPAASLVMKTSVSPPPLVGWKAPIVGKLADAVLPKT